LDWSVTAPVTETVAPIRRRRLPWWLWAVVAIGALIGGIALLGGFEDVPVEQLPEIERGERFDGNEVALQVDDIYLSLTSPVTGYDVADGELYVVVEVTVENTTDSPTVFMTNVLRILIDGAVSANDRPYNIADLRTGAGVPFLQPGLPARVAYVWRVPEGSVEPGDRIMLGIFERYDWVDDPRFDDSKTDPEVVVRLVETVGGFR
jgi:hypothetical protein